MNFARTYVWQGILYVMALIQAIIIVVNLSPAPLYPPPDTNWIPWMYALLPTFITLGIVWLGLLGHQIAKIIAYSKSKDRGIIARAVLWAIAYLFSVLVLLVAVIVLGLSGDYSAVHADDAFVPMWILEIAVGVTCIVQIIIQAKQKRYKELITYVFLLVFAIGLAINQIIVSLSNSATPATTLPFVWFSSLLPLTIAYVYMILWALGVAEVPKRHEVEREVFVNMSKPVERTVSAI
jgi:accessory gene regulator protein AgrB